MATPLTKAELRDEIRRRVAALSRQRRQSGDARIRARILALPAYEAARQVLGFLPMKDEPDIVPLLVRAAEEGKRIYVPVVEENAYLRFVHWAPTDGSGARYGQLGPASSTEAPREDATIILVPARAIDAQGYRLGRGKGCYDRSIPGLRALGPTVGVIYDCQLVNALPREAHDVPVGCIVTESRLLHPVERRA